MAQEASSAALVRSTPSGSLTTGGSDSKDSNSGSSGAPAAADSPRTIRSMAASTRARTVASYVRTLRRISASSGITFALLPATSRPTVTTAKSAGATSRATTDCSRRTVAAAMTTGSTVVSGMDPCPPRPWRVIRRLSVAA